MDVTVNCFTHITVVLDIDVVLEVVAAVRAGGVAAVTTAVEPATGEVVGTST